MNSRERVSEFSPDPAHFFGQGVNADPRFSLLYQDPGTLYDMAALDRFISTSRGDEAVVTFLNHIFPDAASEKASDIHFSDVEAGCSVRYRANNTELERNFMLSRAAAAQIDEKIRSRCKMPLTDRETLLDGSFWFRHDDALIDVRVSIMPTKMGQSIVCRILDQSNAGRNLDSVVMTDDVRAAMVQSLSAPEGMILVVGPTGSGKTSTLYAGLNYLNRPGIHIVTAEDPVEYRLPGANQVQIQSYHRPFPKVLRSFMRQDTDVILVGEIRDDETAQTAIAAANTGHLLLSTMHANNVEISISRLIGLGVDRYTVADALRAFFSQRLMRKLCDCSLPYMPNDEEMKALAAAGVPPIKTEDAQANAEGHGPYPNYFVANRDGCEKCADGVKRNGFVGRVPVIEFALNTDAVAEAIASADSVALKLALRVQKQYQTLTQAALTLSEHGLADFHQALSLVDEVKTGEKS